MPVSTRTHVVYTVRPGDSLNTIANRFATNVPEIVQANSLYPPITEPDLIFPGQKVLVRLPGMSEHSTVVHQVTDGDTYYRLAERYSVGLEMLIALNPTQTPDILRVAQWIYIPAFVYEVEQGDSLFRISRRFGVPMSALARANQGRPGFSPDLIYPGFQLIVPLPVSTNLAVLEPLPGARIAEGQLLSGIARAFEAVVLYQIRDAEDRSVTKEKAITTTAGAPQFGRFNVQLKLDEKPATSSGTLMVYTRSARDGSMQDLVEVPVLF
ncbi:LysM peptidoglycan-binding domain-containing protein [Paenibacillus thermotolerans]|uniref:LysM peptidoglycan-binding domain-containing protein n=1 Tax=Paenibacillus thermotolerans TaxID=3027807 RepID=UPI0023684BF3|nr:MULTISPECIES: LysM peptidoglycan-binding domain-containing protein [unclassified Paenibacillus]